MAKSAKSRSKVQIPSATSVTNLIAGQQPETDVVEDLAAIPQVLEVHAVTGREDLLVRVATTDLAGLQQLIERIVAITGVVHSTITVTLTTPLPYRAVPLLQDMTRDAGWGRSAPGTANDISGPGAGQ